MSSYIEFSYIDTDIIKSGTLAELIEKVHEDITTGKLSHYLESIVPYAKAEQFKSY
jgi:hypothetical protein